MKGKMMGKHREGIFIGKGTLAIILEPFAKTLVLINQCTG